MSLSGGSFFYLGALSGSSLLLLAPTLTIKTAKFAYACCGVAAAIRGARDSPHYHSEYFLI